jgi:hypothetical protein
MRIMGLFELEWGLLKTCTVGINGASAANGVPSRAWCVWMTVLRLEVGQEVQYTKKYYLPLYRN